MAKDYDHKKYGSVMKGRSAEQLANYKRDISPTKKGSSHEKALDDKKNELDGNMKGNPKGLMEKNNRTMMKIHEHNSSWNGKKYTK